MEQIKGSLGSQMQTQQQQQQQQNQSKKKSKNKKKSSKNESNTAAVVTTRSNEEQEQQPIEGVLVENGLTDQLKQQLHIGNDNNTNNSCSSSSSNSNKVNGLMTENLKKSKACPPTTTTNDKLQQPALNGHHVEESLSTTNGDNSCPPQQAVNKKSKRKPNNKKLNTSLEDKETQLENGHCPEMVTNGFSHQEPQQILANETKLNTAMTAVAANNSNATKSTPSNNTNEKTKAESLEPQSKKEKQEEGKALEANALEPIALSKSPELDLTNVHIEYKEYESELQMHDIMRLIQAELSEPYSIYTYRYFIYNWPKLCFLAAHGNEYVGAIVCKLDMYMNVRRGYIAMLAVRKEYRKLKIGTTLVQKAIEAMLADKADEVVLETEMSNLPALRLYENLGFVRDKRLFRYYLNGVDALRLKLWFR